jgi:hypothetical protein
VSEQRPERPRDHLDDVFDRYAEVMQCEYCGKVAPCRPDPYGQRPACKTDWDGIVGGFDE